MKIVKSAPTKTCPVDPIPTSLVKDHINVLIHPITLIINKSLATGHFSTCFKTALITPVIKKKSLDSIDLKNYRPISNLPFMSKVVERVDAARLNAHLIQHNLRDNLQSAYTKFHSVETALVKVHNDIMLAVGNKRVVLPVLLDLSAAFDTVDHKILLHRLQYHFGVQGSALSWFRSYLQDRSQAVNISGELSDRSSWLSPTVSEGNGSTSSTETRSEVVVIQYTVCPEDSFGNGAGWCYHARTDNSPWIQVDFVGTVTIYGLITQGHGDYDVWVTEYQVTYSNDGQSWNKVTVADGTPAKFPGNKDRNTLVTTRLPFALRTRILRIYPTKSYQVCCMRFEVIGCY
ncbi:uncharacterized protein LOC119731359 [Patiria miniata]|uniref:F5/8 type C domain-containing protein n=1 Tax=Patiria miniata TaxID=46514 RepID=A0A914AAK0_PATMI|nr:uncharacterized protein LOC119731359 [Patiria miniata]